MVRTLTGWFFGVLASSAFLGHSSQALEAHDRDLDGDSGCPSFRSVADLDPPEDAENQEANGSSHLRSVGDRSALHVHVRGLEPGATFDVTVSNDVDSAPVGTITTHTGDVPPASRFSARLRPPADDEAGEGDGDGEAAAFRFHRDRGPRGYASFSVNEERTEMRYGLFFSDLETVDGATLTVGELSFDLDVESREGNIEVNEELLSALEAEVGTVSAQSGELELSGVVKPRFSRFREWVAAFLAGRGSLRLDTGRGDALPLEAASIEDLVGSEVSVANSSGEVVLSGVFGELLEGRHFRWRCPETDGDGDGEDGTDDEAAALAFLEVGDDHDASFIRGDANDDRLVNITDSVFVLSYLFLGGTAPYCGDAADADDNGILNLSDPIVILNTLFLGAGSLVAPFPAAGFDTTIDSLTCSEATSS